MCHRLLQPFLEIVTRAVGQKLSKRKDFSGKESADKIKQNYPLRAMSQRAKALTVV